MIRLRAPSPRDIVRLRILVGIHRCGVQYYPATQLKDDRQSPEACEVDVTADAFYYVTRLVCNYRVCSFWLQVMDEINSRIRIWKVSFKAT